MILEPVVILFWLSKVSSTTKVGPTTVSQLIVVEIPAKSNQFITSDGYISQSNRLVIPKIPVSLFHDAT